MEHTALLLLVLAAALAYRRLWRRVRARPRPVTCQANSMRVGWVEVSGRVRGVETVRSPLTGQEVVGYALRVDQERGVTAWETVADECHVADFELEDETGRILVRASVSDIALETDESRGRGGPFRVVPHRVATLLHRHGRPVGGVLFARAFRWGERVLEEGARVRVRGWATQVEATQLGPAARAADPGRYRRLPLQLVLMGGGAHPLQVAAVLEHHPWELLVPARNSRG